MDAESGSSEAGPPIGQVTVGALVASSPGDEVVVVDVKILGVETTAGLGILSLLEMEVGSSRVSGDGMRMAILLSVGWGSSGL